MRIAVGGQKGFTLVEIVMVIVILGIIGGITFQFVGQGVELFKKSRDRKELYDQGRLALERMSREIRDAYEVTECSPGTSFSFKVAHPSTYGVTETEEIKYELVDTDLKRIGNPSGAQEKTAVLASNVDKFEVGAGGGVSGVSAVTTGTTDGGSSITISHTTSGSDRLMLVGVSMVNDGLETVTGVTWNGTENLTLVGTEANADDARVEIWKLVAPSTGTYNVVITFNEALNAQAIGGVMTFTGVDQTTPLGPFASAEADGTLASVDVSSATDELVFGVVAAETPSGFTEGPGQSEHWYQSVGSGRTEGAGSTEAGAATVTTSWTLGSSDHWAIGGVSIKQTTSTSDVIVCDGVVGGGGTTLFSDDFEDGTFAGTWSKVSGIDMQETGGVFTTTGNNVSHYKVDSGSGWTDYSFNVDVVANDDDDVGITFRVEDSNSFYLLEQSFGESIWDLRLSVNDNGTWSTLGSMDNYGSSAGQVDDETTPHNFKVEVSGTNIKAYIDDVLKFDVDDSTVAGGTVGLWIDWAAGTEFDDVQVEEGSGGGVPLVTLRLELDDDPSDEEPGVTMRTKVYMRNMQ
jgi:prepilin-type N-terminal cleavage/methylation domain-containing protein